MQTYKITAYNGWTEKSKVRTIEAENISCARLSKKAVSNVMMANGWYVLKVEDMAGNTLYQGKIEEAC